MILSKMLINQIASYLTKHFKLDKMMNYVFDDNVLDEKVKQLEKRLDLIEQISHPPKEFKCNYKESKKKEIKYG